MQHKVHQALESVRLVGMAVAVSSVSWGKRWCQGHHEFVGESEGLENDLVTPFGHIWADEIGPQKVDDLRIFETSPREELQLHKGQARAAIWLHLVLVKH